MPSGSKTTEEVEETLTAQQEARAKLREGFLRAISELNGEPCNILTYEQSVLEATFSSWNPEGSEVLVHDLKTPAGVKMSCALLRTPDLLAIQFDKAMQHYQL